MKVNRTTASAPIALGLRAARGGGLVVGLAIEGGEPRAVLSGFLATAAEGDRLALEPYHVAAGMARGPQGRASAEAAAAVAEGRSRQDRMAAQGLDGIVRTLKDAGYEPAVAALLVNRAGWITDLLEHSLSHPEHPPIAEGLAVRDALRFAMRRCSLDFADVDEKSLPDTAAKALQLSSADLDLRLKDLGATVARPWRKEQKLAALAAWVALASRR
jgi:hypothetical protein